MTTKNIDYQAVSISETQKLIKSISKEIQEFEQELVEFQTSLEIISNENLTKYQVSSELLKPLQALQDMVNQTNSESQKKEKIELLNQSLRASNKSLAIKKTELLNLQKHLQNQVTEKEFNDNYLIHAQKFQKEFTKNIDKITKQLVDTKTELFQYERDLELLKIWQFNKDYRLPHNLHSKTSSQYIDRLKNEMIIGCQNQIIELNKRLENYNVLQDSEFKNWLIQRVNIDKSLNDLTAIQYEYFDKLKAFKKSISENPDICNFKSHQINSQIPVVQFQDNTIVLIN